MLVVWIVFPVIAFAQAQCPVQLKEAVQRKEKADCPVPLKQQISLKYLRREESIKTTFRVKKCGDGIVLQYADSYIGKIPIVLADSIDTESDDRIGVVSVHWTLNEPSFTPAFSDRYFTVIIWGNRNAKVLAKSANITYLEDIRKIVLQMLNEDIDYNMDFKVTIEVVQKMDELFAKNSNMIVD